MAILESNTDLDVKGRVLATTVPNSTGSIVTWNSTSKVFGLRTNAQIISDLNLSSSFVPYTGATQNVNLGTRSITSTGGFIGNASTATTLATARTINGTSFNGSANIITSRWGTSRNITIGNTTKAVNGSANVSWSLTEIGIPTSSDFITTNTNQTGLSGDKTTSGIWTLGQVRKAGQNDTQMLLAGGGHRPVSDFALAGSLDNYVAKSGDIMTGQLEINKSSTNTTLEPFLDPHIRLSTPINPSMNTGTVGISFATSAAFGYGFSLTSRRTSNTGSDNSFELRSHQRGDLEGNVIMHFHQSTGRVSFLSLSGGGIIRSNVDGTLEIDPNTYVSQSSLNTQLANYATLAGTQTFTGQNTFTQAPIVPNGTSNNHAVNLGQLNSLLPTVNNGQLSLSTGSGLSGSATFTANQSGSSSFSVEIASTHKLLTTAEWNALSTQTLTSSTSNTISGTEVRRAALTGDVTASANSNATTIANSAVTHAKYQNIATQRILGRGATGTGNVQELTLGSNLSLSTSGVLSSTNTNTTYSAGTGLSLSGTTFGQAITTSGSGTFVTGVTQTTNGFQINLGTPPNTNTTYSNMSLTELNTGTVTTARSISAKTLTDWGNGKFALKAHTHNASDINAGVLNIARIPTGTTSTTVALGNHTHSWASITGKPSLNFTSRASTGGSRNSMLSSDTRNVDEIPNTDRASGMWLDFKSKTTINLPSNAGNYAGVLTILPYIDHSGNGSSGGRIALSNSRLFVQGVNATSYKSWNEIWHTGNFTPTNYALVSQLPTVNNGQLTLSTGAGLSGSATFTANQSGSSTFSVAVASTHKLPTTAEWNALSTQTLSNSTSNLIVSNTVQRAALTGDVTASQNSNVTTIANSAVTHAKYQNIATQRILGRGATGTGNVQELTLGSNLSLSTSGVLSAIPTDLTGYATETWTNSQLQNYYTKTESLNQFVGLSGVQDIADTKTFLDSPVVPNPTLDAHAVNKGWVEDEINGVQGQVEAFLVGSTGGRLSLGTSLYHILGKKIDVISMGGIKTAPQDLNQILSGDLYIEIDQIPELQFLAYSSVTLNRFSIGTVHREDVRAECPSLTPLFIELRQGAVTSSPLTSSIFTTGDKKIYIRFHVSGIIIT